VFAVACLGMLLFGIVATTLGAILPDVVSRFGVSRASAGSLLLLLSFSILLGTLLFGPSVDRLGYRLPLTAAATLAAAGLETIAFAPGLAAVRVGVALIGVGGGVLNVATNAVVADTAEGRKAAGLSLLGVFFGIGAVGVPFTLAALQPLASQAAVLATLGGLALLTAVASMLTGFPSPKQPRSFPLRPALRLLREPALLVLGLMLFLQSGMEMTIGGWISIFAGEELALSGQAALFFLSLYWLGMMLARLGLGWLLRTVPPRPVMVVSLALALLGALLLLLARTPMSAGLGAAVVGAGFAAVFPVVYGWLGERYREVSGTAFSLALVIALTGGMVFPYATGMLAERYGMRASLTLVPAALLLSGALLAIAGARRLIPTHAHPEAGS
jgi:fucose permease